RGRGPRAPGAGRQGDSHPRRCARGAQARREVLRVGGAWGAAQARGGPARRGRQHGHAGPSNRGKEGVDPGGRNRRAAARGNGPDAARAAGDRHRTTRGEHNPRRHEAAVYRRHGAGRRLRLRWILRRRGVRSRDQGRDQGHDPGTAGRGVPLAHPARDLHVVRPAGRDGGSVGEGLLTVGSPAEQGAGAGTLLAEAGLMRRGPSLVVEGVRLSELAGRVGPPAYVYTLPVIRARYAALAAALAAVPHRICFALKANGNLGVLRAFKELGAGADIVSGGELARALAAGFPAERIVFSGVGKSDAELVAAVEAGVGHVHLESGAELAALAAIVERRGRPV